LRPHALPRVIEAALAGVAALAAFAGAGAAFAAVGPDVAAAAVAAAYLAAVVAIARRAGVAYAVPLAMVGFLACDWFYVPPTHAYGLPTSANLVELLAFVAVGVLIGRLAADAIRRAERSERANIRARAELADSRARVVAADVDVNVGRLPGAVEATSYFVIAEALTNVAKHAGARRALVAASLHDHTVRVEVKDDGVGGARSDGSGLLGLADRLAAHDGRLELASPRGGGTLLRADIPLSG
jgi:hypothetical protein